METTDPILALALRHREVLAQRQRGLEMIEAGQKVIADSDGELVELDITGRTLARLTGAEWPPASADDAMAPKVLSGDIGTEPKMTVAELVMAAMEDAYRRHMTGLAPRDARIRIKTLFGIDADPTQVSTAMWRLANHQNKLIKDETGAYLIKGRLYMPLRKENPTDAQPDREASAGPDDNPAQGGEARPGGGT